MAPRLGVTSQSIQDRLRAMTSPQQLTNLSSPSTGAIDNLLNGYTKAAALPDPTLDGNPTTDPLQEYLNAGNPPAATNTSTPLSDLDSMYPRDGFTPVGIPDDPNLHNLGGNVVMQQLNPNRNPLAVGVEWGRKLREDPNRGTPVGNRVGDDSALTYNYKNFDEFMKDGARTSQLPPQAYSGNGAGQISGDLGGMSSNVSPGAYTSPTGNYMSPATGLIQQYAASAMKPPQNDMAGAIQNRLAQLQVRR